MERLSIRMAAGAAIGALIMSGALVLSNAVNYGPVLAVLLTALISSFLTYVGYRWHEQSITDDATGLFNRRYLRESAVSLVR